MRAALSAAASSTARSRDLSPGCGRPTGEDRVLKDIAATPYRLDVMISARRLGEFFLRKWQTKTSMILSSGFFVPL